MIDYIIIGIIAFSILVSLLRGFVREVLSLGSWVVAFIVASQFYPYLAAYLTQIESMYIRNGTAIGILFVLTLIVGAIVNSQFIPHFGFIIEWFFQQLQASSSFLNPTLNQ